MSTDLRAAVGSHLAARRARRHVGDKHRRLRAELLCDVRAPLLHRYRIVTAPVDDRRRNARGIEQCLELHRNVVLDRKSVV